jgi:hypothetical protein
MINGSSCRRALPGRQAERRGPALAIGLDRAAAASPMPCAWGLGLAADEKPCVYGGEWGIMVN